MINSVYGWWYVWISFDIVFNNWMQHHRDINTHNYLSLVTNKPPIRSNNMYQMLLF